MSSSGSSRDLLRFIISLAILGQIVLKRAESASVEFSHLKSDQVQVNKIQYESQSDRDNKFVHKRTTKTITSAPDESTTAQNSTSPSEISTTAEDSTLRPEKTTTADDPTSAPEENTRAEDDTTPDPEISTTAEDSTAATEESTTAEDDTTPDPGDSTSAPVESTSESTSDEVDSTTGLASSSPSDSTSEPAITSPYSTETTLSGTGSTSSPATSPSPLPPMSCASGAQYLPHPSDCHKFIQCSNGHENIMNCADGLFWNYQNLYCGYDDSGCYNNSGNVAPDKKICKKGIDFLAHPTDCTKYIQCSNGQPIVQNCPKPLYWNPGMKVCDWSSSSCKTQQQKNETISCAMGMNFDVFPNDCAKFIKCFGERGVLMSCNSGLFWNPVKEVCEKSQRFCQ